MQEIVHVDAFTEKPFAGNPAAVCVMDGTADEEWMQNIAMEMKLTETAFIYPQNGDYNLRWFTPVSEVDLCGHATLASAHVLWEDKHVPADKSITFRTKSGPLGAKREGEIIELNFPATPPVETDCPSELEAALGVKPLWTGKNDFDYLVELESAQAVRELSPDFNLLMNLKARGVIVTAGGENEFDFVSRYFAPSFGINEDPVTGSAHCTLGPYWKSKLNKETFRAYQASKRGGVVNVTIAGNRVCLGGKAVTIMRGQLV